MVCYGDLTTKRSQTVIDKGGIRPHAATVITVTTGKPEQVASLTSACSTAGIQPEIATPQGDPNMPVHDQREPSRALKPIDEATAAAAATPSVLPDLRPPGLAPQAMAPPAAQAAITPMRLLGALRRCWRPAVGLGLIAATIAGVAAWLFLPPPKFTAEATLQVKARAPMLVFATAETQGGGDDYKRYQKTQITLLRSRLVLLKVLQKEEFSKFRTVREAPDPVQWLKDNLEVSFQNESEILVIALKGKYPAELAALVNAIRDAYMDDVVNVERQTRTSRYDQLKELNAKKVEALKAPARARQDARRVARLQQPAGPCPQAADGHREPGDAGQGDPPDPLGQAASRGRAHRATPPG